MSYIGAEPDGMGKAQRFTFTATGTGTAVTADDDGIPIGYTAGQVSVYLNGVKQVIGTGKDVTATDGSTITFLAAYAVDDVIEVVALSIFSATTVEGTALISTGETGGTKFLREDGDGTSSWVTVDTNAGTEAASTNLTGAVSSRYFLSLAYILTGDITLSGTNVLGKIADGTTNVSITNDGSTRTISGSGTLLVNGVMFN